jgi:hypothetical protein
MSSQVTLTPTIISKESLVILENNLVAANRVNRKFENQFVKIGNSLTIRKPNRFTVASGAGLAIQNIAEPSVSITIDKQKHVDFQFTSQDLTLTVEEFSERYLKPAMAGLANQIDYDTLQLFSGVSNAVGTPGTTPAAFSTTVQLVGQRMDENAAPQDSRTLVLNPAAYWALANGLTPSLCDADCEGSARQGLPEHHRKLRGVHGPERAERYELCPYLDQRPGVVGPGFAVWIEHFDGRIQLDRRVPDR